MNGWWEAGSDQTKLTLLGAGIVCRVCVMACDRVYTGSGR